MEFKYRARTQKGEAKEGVVQAGSKATAISALQKEGLFVTGLQRAGSESIWQKNLFGSRVPVKSVAAFARQAAVLLKSGTPVVSALEALATQETNRYFKTIILGAANKVKEGGTFSKALGGYPKIFTPFFTNVVKSGEASGRLSDSLSYLADHLEREYELQSKIKGAMIYPLFVLGVFVLIFVVMIVVVIPNLEKALSQFHEELPVLTRFILGTAHFFSSWGGIALMIILAVGAFLAFQWRKTEKGKKLYHRLVLKLPLKLGILFQKYYLTRFAENLSVLINAGLPISEALKITGEVVGNKTYEEALIRVQRRVIRGEEISASLKDFPELFHPLVIQMINVGEETGTLGDSLQKVVSFYQGEIDRSVDGLSKMIEPVLIILMGVMVGILVVGVFLPIVSVEMGAMNM